MSNCILHEGAITANGYGTVYVNGKTKLAHRWVIEQRGGGLLSPGTVVMHTCDTPACINVDHLVVGTQRDNMLDMVRKRRYRGANITHCPQGHEYTPANTYTPNRHGGAERQCRTCRREQQVKVKEHRKEARRARREAYEEGRYPG